MREIEISLNVLKILLIEGFEVVRRGFPSYKPAISCFCSFRLSATLYSIVAVTLGYPRKVGQG